MLGNKFDIFCLLSLVSMQYALYFLPEILKRCYGISHSLIYSQEYIIKTFIIIGHNSVFNAFFSEKLILFSTQSLYSYYSCLSNSFAMTKYVVKYVVKQINALISIFQLNNICVCFNIVIYVFQTKMVKHFHDNTVWLRILTCHTYIIYVVPKKNDSSLKTLYTISPETFFPPYERN